MLLKLIEGGRTNLYWPKDEQEKKRIIDTHREATIIGETTTKVTKVIQHGAVYDFFH